MDKTTPSKPRPARRRKPQAQAQPPEASNKQAVGMAEAVTPQNKYAKHDRIGANPPIRVGGQKITRVGLGNLTVEDIDGRTYGQYRA